jgi:hypothetical protein
VARDKERREVEGGVRQSETKLKTWCNALFVKMTVIDVKALGEILLGRKPLGRGWQVFDLTARTVVFFLFGDCVGQATRGIYVSEKYVYKGVAGFLAREIGEKNGLHVRNINKLFKYHWTDSVNDHNDVAFAFSTILSHVLDQLIAIFLQVEVVSIATDI